MCYNISAETNRERGVLLLNAVKLHNYKIVGKAPSMCGFTSRLFVSATLTASTWRALCIMAQTKEGAIKIAAKKAGLSVEEYKARLEAGLKRCTKCKEWKPATRFNIDKSRWDGLTAKCTDCTRVKIKKSHKGRVSTFKGKRHSEETKQKISEIHKGNSWRLGKSHTEETKARLSRTWKKITLRGKDHYNYKHGQSQRNLEQRRSVEYREWREQVFRRDGYTCQDCGDNKGGNLNAHHIRSFSEFSELRLDISNGITLCKDCHRKRHFNPSSIRNKLKQRKVTEDGTDNN
jgi:hypothetical protein